MFIITLVKFWESGVVFPSKILQERRSNKDVSLIESVRKAKFLGGNPVYIEAKYIMKSPDDWDRFMRFMDRYSKANDLGFEPASPMRE
mmetsp:Transcript_10141/g.19861  ORF Transcript_10141/g.19861 Transcript_10141/m.19861 type:complete len:88 (-) Transcript_10141:383-646(-)